MVFYYIKRGEEKHMFTIYNHRHTSMACWEHINLLGEYDFSDERVNTITRFDIPKILGLEMG